MSSDPETLPDCRAIQAKGVRLIDGRNYEPVYCANCGKAVVLVPTEHLSFVFWLCQKCETQWSPIAGLSTMPDEVFFQKVAEEQLEHAGRPMTEQELIGELDDPRSTFSALERDWKHNLAKKGR